MRRTATPLLVLLLALLLAVLAGAPALAARPRPLRLHLLVGDASEVNLSRMSAALRLYLGVQELRVIRVAGQPSEASATSQPSSAPKSALFHAWWHIEGRRIKVDLSRLVGGAPELLSFTVAFPEEPTANFYRSVALKLKTLLRVAMASAQTSNEVAASRPTSMPSSAPVRRPESPVQASPPWRFGMALLGGGILPTDTGQPVAKLGALLSLRRGWLELALQLERGFSDTRHTVEGSGEMVLSEIVATLSYRHTHLLTPALGWVLRGGVGGGVGWVEASGRLASDDDERSATAALGLFRFQISTGFVLWRGLELSVGAAADVVVNRARIELRERELALFGPLIPHLELALRATL